MMRMNELILSNGGYWGRDGVGMSTTLSRANKGQLDVVLNGLNSFDEQTSMSFAESEFGDSHIAQLLGHRRLKNLLLNSTQVTDIGLQEIAVLKELIDLELDNTAVTDAGLEQLAKLPELQFLSLNKTAITDVGLEHLAKAPKLEHLHVSGTKVTDEGIAKLKRALPALEVNVYYGR